jgi:TolB-like protein
MLTGRRAFRRDTAIETMNAILKEEPSGFAGSAPEISPALERVVRHCLEKNPAERFQSARDIAFALGEASTGSAAGAAESGPGGSIRSLVVLPFENRSGDPAQEFFSDGMTDALIADLAQIAALGSSRALRRCGSGTHPTLSQLARELGVDAVVEGSALRVGDRVRITVQLVDVASDRNLWAKSYDRGLSDILGLQSEVARAIADEIRIQVTPEERARLRSKGAVNPAAHVAYLQGLFLWNRFTNESVTEAILRFESDRVRPTTRWPTPGSPTATSCSRTTTSSPPKALLTGAQRRAASLRDSLAGSTSLGWIHRLFDWDWPAAESECRRRSRSIPAARPQPLRWFCRGWRHERPSPRRNEHSARSAQPAHPPSWATPWHARLFDARCVLPEMPGLDPTFGAAHDLRGSLEHVGQTMKRSRSSCEGSRASTADRDLRPASRSSTHAPAGRTRRAP